VRFAESFVLDTRQLVTELAKHVTKGGVPRGKELNIAISYFIKDLFSMADRGFVLDLVNDSPYFPHLTPVTQAHLYLTGLNAAPTPVRTFNFTFLRIIVDHEHYLPLNLPIPDKIDSISHLVERLWLVHGARLTVA
jgi:hypothetical protein